MTIGKNSGTCLDTQKIQLERKGDCGEMMGPSNNTKRWVVVSNTGVSSRQSPAAERMSIARHEAKHFHLEDRGGPRDEATLPTEF